MSVPKVTWRKQEVPATNMRRKWKEAGHPEYVDDPLFDWVLCGPNGDVLVTVKWDKKHGWDAYSHINGGYLPGKWSGPDMSYEDEAFAKRAAELHVVEYFDQLEATREDPRGLGDGLGA